MSIEDRLRDGLARDVSFEGVEQALKTTLQRQRTRVRRRMVAGLLLAGALIAFSPWFVHRLDSGGAGQVDPAATVPAAPMPFEGSWVSHLTRHQVVHQIRAAGLGRWVHPFLAHEQIGRNQTFVYSFTNHSFQVADYEPGGGWHVGWAGSLKPLPGHHVQLHDDFSGATDVYTWHFKAGRLHLVRVSSDTRTVYGIPYQVYDAAYVSDSWKATECKMRTGQDC